MSTPRLGFWGTPDRSLGLYKQTPNPEYQDYVISPLTAVPVPFRYQLAIYVDRRTLHCIVSLVVLVQVLSSNCLFTVSVEVQH